MSDLALPFVIPPVADPRLADSKYKNLLASLRNRRQRRVTVDSNPWDLTIDLTSACQLECPYCSTGAGTIERRRSTMKEDLFRKLLGEVGEDCFIIWYFSNGEPLLHKRFGEFVGTTKDKEIFSVISTNLSLPLSDAFLGSLIGCGLGIISVSIDGASPETYRQYRRGGDFNLVLDNVRRLVALKRQRGLTYPLIEWRFLRFQHNEHEEAAARGLAVELGVDLLEFWPGAVPPDGSPKLDGVFRHRKPLRGPAVSGPGLDLLAARQAERGLLAQMVPPSKAPGGLDLAAFTPKCDWLYFSGMVHPTGRVGPCCVSNDEPDDFVESIDDFDAYNQLFNSPKYTSSRSLFSGGGLLQTICWRCPSKKAQHYQFRNKMRAVLRNAPDRVVGLLAADPDRYFLPEDRVMVPEVNAIYASASSLASLREPALAD